VCVSRKEKKIQKRLLEKKNLKRLFEKRKRKSPAAPQGEDVEEKTLGDIGG